MCLLTSQCLENKPSCPLTSNFLPFNFQKNLRVNHAYWFRVRYTLFLSYRKKERRIKNIFPSIIVVSRGWFDKKSAGENELSVGDLVLKWDKAHKDKGKYTKFQSLWFKPYTVHDNIGHHTYHLQYLDGRLTLFLLMAMTKQYFQ